MKKFCLALALLAGASGAARAATVFYQPMTHSTSVCNASGVCPLQGGSACTGTFPGTCTNGFDTNASDVYRDDIPVYTLVPDPTTIDSQTGTYDNPSNSKLLVFLHGTGGGGNTNTGINHLNFLHAASYLGYHVISLDYYDSQEVPRGNCGCNTYCYGYLRHEQFDATFYSPTGSAKPKDYDMYTNESVTARLTTVLNWLNSNQPTLGWGTFLTSGQVNWSTVVMSGHSQGAGLAAFAGKQKSLLGVFMLSGIMDSTNESGEKDQYSGVKCRSGSPTNSVPNWVSDNHFGANTGFTWATSDIMKYWGIRGTRDTNTCNADCSSAVKQSWDAMALNTAHLSGYGDGYGTIDLQGQGGNDYVLKGRRGLYAGTGSDTFSSCLDGVSGSGTPAVSAAVTSPTPETCEATHTSIVNADLPNLCEDGTTFYSSYTKLYSAWLNVLSNF